jgi:predicted ATP-grasp superfamily ATP-dependent carboligase
MRILVIGVNIRHIACSARRAGHEVFAVDGYCDLDLERCAEETARLPREGLEESISLFIEKFQPEAVLLGPGLEEAHVLGVPVLNNPPEKTSQVSDKLWLASWLEKSGFPFIKTYASAQDLGFPILVKPRKGAGGVGCRRVDGLSDLLWEEGLIAQEIISGKAASVSVIGNGREARALAVNEQLIGASWAGAKGFRYSGNITPLDPPQCNVAKMAEEIIARLGLVGSNGVDFLLTEKGPVVVEVNCRFQGSLDTVEMATGVNVFQAHLQSFKGRLPPTRGTPSCFAGRAIVYATSDIEVKADLLRPWTSDVPGPGSRIGRDDPILSILAKGSDRNLVLAQLKKRTAMLIAMIE